MVGHMRMGTRGWSAPDDSPHDVVHHVCFQGNALAAGHVVVLGEGHLRIHALDLLSRCDGLIPVEGGTREGQDAPPGSCTRGWSTGEGRMHQS